MNRKKLLKKILFTLLLGPLVLFIGIPGENDGDNNNNDGDNNNNDGNNNNNDGDAGNSDGSNNSNEGQVIFKSQSDFDKVIQKRIATAVKKTNIENEEKIKLANMTEVDRLKQENNKMAENQEKVIKLANEKLIKAEIINKAAKLKVIDTDAAYLLISKENIEINENGVISGVDESLEKLVKEKAYLFNASTDPKPGGDDQNQNKTKNKLNFDMNSIIRNATGRK